MADDTITVNMMPSCGSCKKQADYDGYKKYTKTWKNLCTSTTCQSKYPGTLQNNPKGTYEGELTCSRCDSDYCGFCGTEKSGSARFKLVAADATSTTTNTSGGSKSIMSFWESLEDLQKPHDGMSCLSVNGDRVIYKKIPDPSTAKLYVKQGVNLIKDSLTIHDYNPDTPNKLYVSWGENFDKLILITNQKLIDRFGEKIKEVKATKKVTTYVEEAVSSTDSSTTGTDSTSTDSSTTDTSSTGGTGTSNSSSSSSTSSSHKGSVNNKSKKHSTVMWIRGKKKVYRSGSVYREVGTHRIYGEKYRWDSKKKKWKWVPKTG